MKEIDVDDEDDDALLGDLFDGLNDLNLGAD